MQLPADFDAHHEAVLGIRSDKQLDDVDWGRVKHFYLNNSTPSFWVQLNVHTLAA
jgi:hypothetical protein